MTLRRGRAAGLPLTLAAILAVAPVAAQQRNPERNAYFGETHIPPDPT